VPEVIEFTIFHIAARTHVSQNNPKKKPWAQHFLFFEYRLYQLQFNCVFSLGRKKTYIYIF